jgi:hypothetical protein
MLGEGGRYGKNVQKGTRVRAACLKTATLHASDYFHATCCILSQLDGGIWQGPNMVGGMEEEDKREGSGVKGDDAMAKMDSGGIRVRGRHGLGRLHCNSSITYMIS